MKKRIRKFAYVACNGGEHNHNCHYGCIGVTTVWVVGCVKKPVRSRSSTCTMWENRFWYAAPIVIWEHRREMPVM